MSREKKALDPKIGIVGGQAVLEGVMMKNMATPYMVDEYAVVIATKDPQRPTIHLRVGYDGGLAGELTAQIDRHIFPKP